MHDADVRPPLMHMVKATYPEARVLPELGLEYGLVRVDMAALSPARLHGYEVKADADTLRCRPRPTTATAPSWTGAPSSREPAT
ncbi:hypothetical protein OV208_18535 [Corallococcus sp. bb12-1]|uniref:hypothetical protein n=1 Tax=Corallococcus sp. bb12-1 TaxID=2996784 RepID=UPI00226DC16B|nr:hypothetical protein [Corallococcus sp. bb12-1]MCY1043321.1 hypothetical protein [Corallococcus sp. bb12-1]